MDAQQGLPKRVRGPTRKQAIWDFEPGKKFTDAFERGQPVGDEAKELTSFLETFAKMSQHIDISIKDWRKVEEKKKEDLWSIVKEKFEFSPVETEEIKLWVMSYIGRKCKTWKQELKNRHFDSSLTIDEIVAAQTDGTKGGKEECVMGENGPKQGNVGNQVDGIKKMGYEGNRNNKYGWVRNDGKVRNKNQNMPKSREEYRTVTKKMSNDEKMEKENSNKENDNVNIPKSVEPKSPWKVAKAVVEDIRKSANKFSIMVQLSWATDGCITEKT